jgi:hypothetical protein
MSGAGVSKKRAPRRRPRSYLEAKSLRNGSLSQKFIIPHAVFMRLLHSTIARVAQQSSAPHVNVEASRRLHILWEASLVNELTLARGVMRTSPGKPVKLLVRYLLLVMEAESLRTGRSSMPLDKPRPSKRRPRARKNQ